MKVGGEELLQLGHPGLRTICRRVETFEDPDFHVEQARLLNALRDFRARFGFGRAIAAPQIGIAKRFIAIDLGSGPFIMVNPVVTWTSDEKFSMWDDCMSFPSLLVRVARHRSISVNYEDDKGALQLLERLGRSQSELLQHEIDHLDGRLAIDRAVDANSIITREAMKAMPDYFLAQVDYVVGANAGSSIA